MASSSSTSYQDPIVMFRCLLSYTALQKEGVVSFFSEGKNYRAEVKGRVEEIAKKCFFERLNFQIDGEEGDFEFVPCRLSKLASLSVTYEKEGEKYALPIKVIGSSEMGHSWVINIINFENATIEPNQMFYRKLKAPFSQSLSELKNYHGKIREELAKVNANIVQVDKCLDNLELESRVIPFRASAQEVRMVKEENSNDFYHLINKVCGDFKNIILAMRRSHHSVAMWTQLVIEQPEKVRKYLLPYLFEYSLNSEYNFFAEIFLPELAHLICQNQGVVLSDLPVPLIEAIIACYPKGKGAEYLASEEESDYSLAIPNAEEFRSIKLQYETRDWDVELFRQCNVLEKSLGLKIEELTISIGSLC